MALAQEPFPTEVEGEDPETQRKSRPSRVRKAAADEGRLARMVRELRDIEDDIVAKLAAADRLLGQLEARRVHEDGGYGSSSEFEQRMLASTPNLAALREAIPGASSTRLNVAEPRRDSVDIRTRQTRALTSIARTLEKLRGLDAEIGRSAITASSQLRTIERMRIYDECGYASFEEFLERALGPSPVLASVLALVPNDSLADQAPATGEQGLPTAGGDSSMLGVTDDDFPPALFGASAVTDDPASSMFGEAPGLFDGSPSPSEDAPSAVEQTAADGATGDPAPPAGESGPNRRRRIRTVLVSVVLSAAAAIAGAAAGNWSVAVPAPPPAAEEPAQPTANPTPSPAPVKKTAPTPKAAPAQP